MAEYYHYLVSDALAQHSRNEARTRFIHPKITSRRKDALHKFGRQLVNRYGTIIVGDVSP